MQKKRRRVRRIKRKHRKMIRLFGLLFVCFLFIYGGIYLALRRQVSKIPKDKICEGIYVGQVDVSGLTKKEAKEAVDAKAEEYKEEILTFQWKKESVDATFGELGFEIENEEKLIEKALRYGKDGGVLNRYFKTKKLKKEKKVFEPRYEISEEAAGEVLVSRVGKLLKGATNAAIIREGSAFLVTEEADGVEIDPKATMQEVRKFLNGKWKGKSGTVKVVERVQKPTITKAQLETITDKLGSFSTYCGSGQARVTNIRVATERINGAVLMPGQEYSANDGMSPFSEEDGYVDAGAYENGEIVQSLGGGICQVSTTLYNAVIHAELEVTSRQPHSMLVDYVKPSRDAAIAGDYKDLKFKNNLETPVYIEGYLEDGNVVFNIYGKETRPAGRTIEFISETLSTQDRPKKYVEDKEAQIGSIKETRGGTKGAKARLWKVVKENGKEVSREVFNNSTYKPSTNKVSVGTKSGNSADTSKMRTAIKTQNEEKIKKAIAEIKAAKAG